MIDHPVTIAADATVKQVLNIMREYHIGGVPVVDAEGYLMGIVTNRDLRFERNMKRPVSEVMTKENLITAGPHTSLKEAADIFLTIIRTISQRLKNFQSLTQITSLLA